MQLSQEEYRHHVAAVWKVTGILSAVTIIEVGIALLFYYFMGASGLRWGLNVFMVVASLIKAFYIVSVFMHLKYEREVLAATILMPLAFFIWFIISFIMEGSAWLEMRTPY